MIRFFLMLLSGCVFSFYSLAQDDPTIVYGAANTADGKKKEFVVEQPKNGPNPLGNPIVGPDNPVEVYGDLNSNFEFQSENQSQPQSQFNNDADNNSVNQNDLGNDFENTLLEANGRVYDVQSYPKADFNAMENPADPQTIYSPNVNN